MSHKINSKINVFVSLLIFIQVSNGLNLGLISGDLKRTSSPLIIRKNTHHSPLTINIKSGIPRLPAKVPNVIIPSKKPAIKAIKKRLLTKPLRLHKVPKLPKLPKLSKLPKLPKIPKLPLLPLLPPLLPPLIPKIPLLPPLLLPLKPILPRLSRLPSSLPRLSKALRPLRIPILSKTGLKALGSEIRPIKVPVPNFKKHILDKLLKLRRDGSLTASEFIRFKKLLL